MHYSQPPLVAPPTGAWIETSIFGYGIPRMVSRLPQARGLKHSNITTTATMFTSRLPQARGLKLYPRPIPIHGPQSRLPQARGLKHEWST